MSKKKYIILGIVLIIVFSLGITYAWYMWQSSDDEVTMISASLGVARVVYGEGSDIVADIYPVSSKEDGVIKEVTVKSLDSTSQYLSFNLYLDALELDDVFKHESFRYAVYKDGTLLKEGNFTETFEECSVNNTTHIVLVEGESITTSTSTYTLYLWIDGVNYTNPTEMQNKTIKLKLHASGENAILMDGSVSSPVNAVDFITSLYDIADKKEVTNNNIIYNYNTAFSLMNDRLGGTTSDYDAGNIRYYGANPNNYIDIGDVYAADGHTNLWEAWGYENYDSCVTNIIDSWDCSSHWEGWGDESEEACVQRRLETAQSYGFSTYEDFQTYEKEFYCGKTYTEGEPILYRIIGVFKNMELSDGTTDTLDLFGKVFVYFDKKIC